MSETIHLLDERTLRAPLLIAGFATKHGQTPALAARHLVEAWEAEPLADIDPEEFFDFTVQRPVVWLDGETRRMDWPANRLYAARVAGLDRDVILLPGLEPHLRWRSFCEAIVRFISRYAGSALVTLGARHGNVPHTRRRPVRVLDGHGAVARMFRVPAAASSYEGPVGIATVLREQARAAGVETVTLEAMMPFYLQSSGDPEAAIALVQAVDEALGTTTAVEDLEAQGTLLSEQIAVMVEELPQLATTVRWLEEQFDWFQSGPSSRPGAALAALAAPFDTEQIVAEVEELLQNPQRGTGHTSGTTL
jgi:predicted ATP-grasp superfamily ATP-dependent carboligase